MNYCEFPNGRIEIPLLGTYEDISCDNPACTRIRKVWYCAFHAGMAERGYTGRSAAEEEDSDDEPGCVLCGEDGCTGECGDGL
jgi:hypothetical protein